MEFGLTEEQRQVQKAAHAFAKREFPAYAKDADRNETYPHELVRKAAAQGFVGAVLPTEYGGAGIGMVTACLIAESFNRVDAGLAGAIGATDFGTEAILKVGTDEQKERWLPGIPKGEVISGAAISEAGAGSDVAGATTTAVLEGDEYVVNGSKMWITNGTVCDYLVTLVQTDQDNPDRHRRFSLLVIPMDLEGVTANKIRGKLGIRASDTAEIELDDVRVPAENLLGKEGDGFRYVMGFFNNTRIGVAAQGVGIAQGCVDLALDYAKQREAFGRTIADFQAIQFKLAEMNTRTQAARLLTLNAAWHNDQGRADPQASSMAKWYAGEAAVWCANESLQVHGGMGFIDEMDIERFYRDAKITEIYEGTKEIHKLIIARAMLGRIQ